MVRLPCWQSDGNVRLYWLAQRQDCSVSVFWAPMIDVAFIISFPEVQIAKTTVVAPREKNRKNSEIASLSTDRQEAIFFGKQKVYLWIDSFIIGSLTVPNEHNGQGRCR